MPLSDRLHRCEQVRLEVPSGAACLLHLAESFTVRLIGYAGLGEPPEHGLLIPRCRSVHTFGMRFAIDVVFLSWPPSKAGQVRALALRERVPPGRVVRLGGDRPRSRHSVAVAELPSRLASALGLHAGTEAVVTPVSSRRGVTRDPTGDPARDPAGDTTG